MPATRVEQVKKISLLLGVIILVVTPILAFSPLGPSIIRDYIYEQNPAGEPVKPWATEWMYKLGRFYNITLRDAQAQEVYHKLIFKWYAQESDERKIDEQDPWVGMAVYHYAMYKWDTGHKRRGAELLAKFIQQWEEAPGVDPTLTDLARKRLIVGEYSDLLNN